MSQVLRLKPKYADRSCDRSQSSDVLTAKRFNGQSCNLLQDSCSLFQSLKEAMFIPSSPPIPVAGAILGPRSREVTVLSGLMGRTRLPPSVTLFRKAMMPWSCIAVPVLRNLNGSGKPSVLTAVRGGLSQSKLHRPGLTTSLFESQYTASTGPMVSIRASHSEIAIWA